MDVSSTATPSPSSAAATTAAYDAARDKTNEATASTTSAVGCEGGRGSSGIQLLIKSSNQQYDDINIESDLCWTVQRLKKQLSLVYPGKPKIKDQKLIYSGKLLEDAQKLSEVIRSYKDVYQQHHIFHLVCVNRNMAKAPLANSLPKSASSMTTVTTNTTDNELRHRGMLQPNGIPLSLHEQNQNNQMPGVQAASTSASTAESATNAQIAFHQQQAMLYNAWLYQWYTIYMQQAQRGSGSSAVLPPTTLPPFMQNFPPIGVPFGAYQPAAPADPAATVASPGEPNEAAVAQPAARAADGPNFPNIIQEEPEVRDWLDSFFSFTRLAIFITVLYLNSSPLRCLMVVFIASGIYLYHVGALRRRREHNNNNINRNNNAGNNNGGIGVVHQIQRMMDAEVDNDNNARGAADAEPAAGTPGQVAPAAEGGQHDGTQPAAAGAGTAQSDGAVAAAEAVAVDPANVNNSVISNVRTFVITFFTSMLPEATAL